MRFDTNKLTKEKQYCEELFDYYIKIKALRKTNPDYKKNLNKAVSNLEFANFLLEEHNLLKKPRVKPGACFLARQKFRAYSWLKPGDCAIRNFLAFQ